MVKRIAVLFCLLLAISGIYFTALGAGLNAMVGINVVLNRGITDSILADLSSHGTVRDIVYELNAVTLQAPSGEMDKIRALPYVSAANIDAVRNGGPIDTVLATNYENGLSTWDLDAINVTDFGFDNRRIPYDGAGVYVAVLDTGLLDSWRQYFPQERIAAQYGIAFGGGGGDVGTVSSQPLKWEHDQNSHGTHVTSSILGYKYGVNPINGVAPMATIIPVKVLNQNGSGWSSVIARGIVYVTDLKLSGKLGSSPVVINMSLGGSVLDGMEAAAIDYAIDNGVIVVASAGNSGARGMGYPGAYAPVISVAASGWTGEWNPAFGSKWWYQDVADPIHAEDFYIVDFSSREKPGQDLDVAAPGSWILGPYQVNSGQISYYYLGGTSMASPHVAGIVALMVQKNPALTAADAEAILETSAVYLAPGSRDVRGPDGGIVTYTWEKDATGAGLVDAEKALGMTSSTATKRKNK